eukprot:SAG31_NODE_1793_length_7241_cov_2.075611_6_plen_425_part_00
MGNYGKLPHDFRNFWCPPVFNSGTAQDPCRRLRCADCVARVGCGWCNATDADGKIEPLPAGELVCRSVQPGSQDQLRHCSVDKKPPPDLGLSIVFSAPATNHSAGFSRAAELYAYPNQTSRLCDRVDCTGNDYGGSLIYRVNIGSYGNTTAAILKLDTAASPGSLCAWEEVYMYHSWCNFKKRSHGAVLCSDIRTIALPYYIDDNDEAAPDVRLVVQQMAPSDVYPCPYKGVNGWEPYKSFAKAVPVGPAHQFLVLRGWHESYGSEPRGIDIQGSNAKDYLQPLRPGKGTKPTDGKGGEQIDGRRSCWCEGTKRTDACCAWASLMLAGGAGALLAIGLLVAWQVRRQRSSFEVPLLVSAVSKPPTVQRKSASAFISVASSDIQWGTDLSLEDAETLGVSNARLGGHRPHAARKPRQRDPYAVAQ